jgi:hypothetical protein
MSDMNGTQLDPLDGLVRRRLASELDGQLGKAEAAFLRHVGTAQQAGGQPGATVTRPRAVQPRPGGRFMRFGGWTFSLAGAALAASIAALWTAPAIFQDHANTGRPADHPHPTASLQQQPMIHYVQDRTWDGGPVIVNDDEDGGAPRPARRYVRERIERTRWYDPQQKAWAETTVPQQDEAIVPVDTY